MRILSLAPLGGPALERLAALGDLEVDPWIDHTPIRLHSAEDLLARLGGVDVLLVEADDVPAVAIEASALRIIGSCRGAPVNVDVAAATARGIPVLNAPGRNAEAVAEMTLGLLIALLRGIVAADGDVRAGRIYTDTIPQQRYRGREVRSLTVGLVGFGGVGRAAARKLVALGATVIAFDPHVPGEAIRAAGAEPVDLETLMRRSDAVSIHAALTGSSRGLIGERELKLVRPGTLLVNTARYDLVSEEALLDALRDGRLGGAALDHFPNELLPPGHPLVAMRNVILTPHLGGTTEETIWEHTRLMAEGLEALRAGRAPGNVVNPDALGPFFSRADRTG